MNKFRIISIILIFTAFFTGCKKDNYVQERPSITSFIVGHDNDKIGHPGADLHIEATIVAPAKIKEVQLEIHPEQSQTWSLNQTYTDGFSGVKNADFHKHIDIPVSAELGEYHVHLTVIDESGNSTTVESTMELIDEE